MKWVMLLRRNLLAQLLDVEYGGWLKILLNFKGDLAEAETVLPTSVYEVLKHYVDGRANIAESVKAANGADTIMAKVVLSGNASMNQTIIIEGRFAFMLDLLAELEAADFTQHGASLVFVYIPTTAEAASAQGTGGEGAMSFSLDADTDGTPIISYRYATEENDAGGTTYNIISDYYAQDGGTMYIGGQYGDQ